jgi:endonuclease/exonuclease/phosphatase family metal-dependent hydrolase
MAPHLLGMQEVFSTNALAQLCHEHKLNYFAVPHPPKAEDEYLHRHPVVALASRYEISEAQPVTADPGLARTMGLSQGFAFSRAPLRALVQVPGFGPVRVYLVHFKSARPQWEPAEAPETPSASVLLNSAIEQQDIKKSLIKPVLGGWASVMQRGAESALLIADIIDEQLKRPLPTILMGDFNDELNSAAFRSIAELNRAALKETEACIGNSQTGKVALKGLAMQDLFALTLDESEPRPTHFWGARGSRLDHILLSSEFDPGYAFSHAQVDRVRIYDRHLLCNDVELDRQCSDHAAVLAEISVRI